METHRIVNLRYKINNYQFDAAVDIHYCLHYYEEDNIEKSRKIPIELYNFDKPEWDIKVIFVTNKELGFDENQIINYPDSELCHTFVPIDFIIRETMKWIKENK